MLYPIQNNVRNRLDLSGIWDFKTDPDNAGKTDGWFNGLTEARPIAVPGSWNEQYEDLFNYFDLAWYVTRSYIPAAWQGERVFIRVGSACYFGTVYVNGQEVGSHEGGHLPFAFEITDLIKWDAENVIAISVENELKPTRVPSANMSSELGLNSYPRTTYDFFPFAGLHRPVVLYTVPRTYIEDVAVVTEINGKDGLVKVTARLNEPVSGKGSVTLSGGTKQVQVSLSFENGVAEAKLVVPSAHLWSDKDPYLYDLTVATSDDRYTLQIGIRTIAVRGNQILLNGQPVQLNGFGRHEDFFASGKGLNLPLLVKDYQLMRWTGANSYRTSHYPYSEEEMRMADREGFLIIDEIPAVSLNFDTPENMAERLRMCLQQIDELVARDKNHPSVVMWSVANEPLPKDLMSRMGKGIQPQDPRDQAGQEFLTTLVRRARQLDPTRLVTLVGVMGGPQEWLSECDVICLNRYWGWYVYGGELQRGLEALEHELDETWNIHHKPVVMTEFGADTQAGLHGLPSVMWTEEYQAELIRGYLEVASRKPFVAGMHVWNFADFAAVQGTMRVGGLNLKGVFTRSRTPKMAAHVLREIWVTRPQANAKSTNGLVKPVDTTKDGRSLPVNTPNLVNVNN
ncbi:MAG TPA: beta-glucuronidase [Chloroflexia bacterium]|nr:beta-glucuronidase [Chloroflexia bacterium]